MIGGGRYLPLESKFNCQVKHCSFTLKHIDSADCHTVHLVLNLKIEDGAMLRLLHYFKKFCMEIDTIQHRTIESNWQLERRPRCGCAQPQFVATTDPSWSTLLIFNLINQSGATRSGTNPWYSHPNVTDHRLIKWTDLCIFVLNHPLSGTLFSLHSYMIFKCCQNYYPLSWLINRGSTKGCLHKGVPT